MNVALPTAVTPPSQAQAQAVTHGGKATDANEFKQALVYQMNSGASTESDGTEAAAPAEPIAVEGATKELTVLPTLGELIVWIDELLNSLDEPAIDEQLPQLSEEQLTELEAALDQLSALLALLGIPVVQVMPNTNQAMLDSASAEHQLTVQAATAKSNIQDLLMQLQAAAELGAVKYVQKQEPSQLIAEQLQALQALVNKLKGSSEPELSQEAAKMQDLFQSMNAKASDASTLLQRLSQQSANPAVLSITVNAEQSGETGLQAETSGQQQATVQAPQLNINQAELFRNTLTAASKGNPAQVPADQFAETMTEMIVQKFDIRTLNGVSEAKLMLYPEHMGQVDVRITIQNGQLQAVFLTDTAMAKDALDNQMAQLRAALQAQGLVVDKLDVAQSSSAAGLLNQHRGQGHTQQQFTNQQASGNGDLPSEASLEVEKSEIAAAQGLGFGRAINVKA